MTRYTPLTALCFCLGAMACQGTESTPKGDDGLTTTLRLEENGAGQLELCDAAGSCETVSNPDQCAILEVSINNTTGSTCERCLDATGTTTYERCGGTTIACTVVTVPAEDCVVCAHVDGPVIYSTCVPEEPRYCEFRPLTSSRGGPGEDATTADGCKVCYDDDGHEVLNECGGDCSHVSCPEILCAPGYRPVRRPGDCCEVCVPIDDCSEVACTATNSVPDCPEGTRLVRDPSDCCGYFCEPFDCSLVMCPAVVLDCPPGTRPSYEYPNCCGTCLPDEPKYCMSDADCGAGTICAKDDCYSPCSSNTDPDQACTTVCYGLCKPDGHVCDPLPMDPASLPYTECQGEWVEMVDEFGCPLPPRCVCADGTVTWDGRCADECANYDCATFAPCPEGTHPEKIQGHCCDVCVPDADEKAQCLETGGRWDESSCGHYACGQQPLCEALIPGCDCGEGRSFRPGYGCVEDPNCSGASCTTAGSATGGYQHGDSFPADDGCNTCTCWDGQILCTEMACAECWGAWTDSTGTCRSPNDGIYPSECCAQARLCEGTGGTWDEASCGHYTCGEFPDCDAVVPGCNCGAGRNFDPNKGCHRDETCAPKDCLTGSQVYHEGDSFPAGDGCNTCVCQDGQIYCTRMACQP